MNNDIEQYLNEFEQWVVGSDAHRAECRAELEAHLSAAADADDLQGALARLGSPRAAAAAFSSAPTTTQVSVMRRWWAAVMDNAPIIGVGIALPVPALVDGAHGFAYTVIPFVDINHGQSLLQNVGVPLAIAWSVLVLAVFEARTGQTPGKRLLHLQTVSTSGTRPTLGQAIVRRLSFLTGWFAVVDWILGCNDHNHQRIFDHLANTRVVDAPV